MKYSRCLICYEDYPSDDGPSCDCSRKRRNERQVDRVSNSDYLKESQKFFNSKRWKTLRAATLRKCKGICLRCFSRQHHNYRFDDKELHAHHIKSRLNYPELKWSPDNLICVCKTCNSELGTTDKLDFDLNKTLKELRELDD